jgi:DNA-binding CsgD family transcriptional regulator
VRPSAVVRTGGAFGASAGLVGREAEIEAILRAFAGLPERGGALLLHGEPGIGKTALLEFADTEADRRDIGRLRAVGVQSESDIPFAGLHQLVRPVIERADDLPAQQRNALLTAMGIVDGPPPERFLIALATLEVLAMAATVRPLLITVEDLHWLDRASADVLGFVARRIDSEPLLLIAASRQGPDAWPADRSAWEVPVGPLAPDAAQALMDRSGVADPALRRRILHLAAGNPLALVELPQTVDRTWVANDQPDRLIPLTARLERSFAARTAGLPESTRIALLVAALEDGLRLPEAIDVVRVLRPGDLTVADIRPAVRAGLVAEGAGRLHFLHPLVRSAVQFQAGPDACRAAHVALGEVLAASPERAIWHRAAACVDRDDVLAAELVTTAEVALGRGALADAAKRLERAAQLSVDAKARIDLLLRAAEAAAELNDWPLAESLLAAMLDDSLDVIQAARRERVRERFGEVPFANTGRIGELISFADAAGGAGQVALALELLLEAALRCFWTMPAQPVRDSVVRAAERLPVPGEAPVLLAILAVADPESFGDTVSHHIAGLGGAPPDTSDDARLLGFAAYAVRDFTSALALLSSAADRLRSEGRLGALGSTLVPMAWAAIALGELNTALAAAEEGERLCVETGLETWTASAIAGQAIVIGLRGRAEEATRLADRAQQLHGPSLPAMATGGLHLARAVTAYGIGRYEAAYDELKRLLDPSDPSFLIWDYLGGASYLADTAVILGRLDELRLRASRTGFDLSRRPSEARRPGEAHALAVLADTDEAIEDALKVTTSAFDRARLQLARGRRLRRHRAILAAREPLRAARDEFDRLGTIPWGEMARQELRSAGEPSERRPERAWDSLSSREVQIARLVAAGLSNKEIGSALFFSHRTVASHLYRIFPKLGITSRAQLAGVLRVVDGVGADPLPAE